MWRPLGESLAGARWEFDVIYDLAPGVLRRNGEHLETELLVQKQHSVRMRDMSVAFILPSVYTDQADAYNPGDDRVRWGSILTLAVML